MNIDILGIDHIYNSVANIVRSDPDAPNRHRRSHTTPVPPPLRAQKSPKMPLAKALTQV